MPADQPRCACPRGSAYECWAARYDLRRWDGSFVRSRREIEADGGPCECFCHELRCDGIE